MEHSKSRLNAFYIYAYDEEEVPVQKIDPAEFDTEWQADVANKKPFWYDFNNCLDLSIHVDNQNLSKRFLEEQKPPVTSTPLGNSNVLEER